MQTDPEQAKVAKAQRREERDGPFWGRLFDHARVAVAHGRDDEGRALRFVEARRVEARDRSCAGSPKRQRRTSRGDTRRACPIDALDFGLGRFRDRFRTSLIDVRDSPFARRVHEDAQDVPGRPRGSTPAPRPTMTTSPRAAYSRTASCTASSSSSSNGCAVDASASSGVARSRLVSQRSPSVRAVSSLASTASGEMRSRLATTTGSCRSTYS